MKTPTGMNKDTHKELESFRKFLENQIMGEQAQIDNHQQWRERGIVEEKHLHSHRGAKVAYEESLFRLQHILGDFD